jgi:Cu-Zn family superoxide dismutase
LRRITKAAIGGLAGCALALGGVQAASGESFLRQLFSDNLTDLDKDGAFTAPVTTGAFDLATADLKVTESEDGTRTTFWIRVKGIDLDFAGKTFGSHLHTGPCTGDYGGVSGHYNDDPSNQTQQPLRDREVWFDLIPNEDGVAVDKTVRPFPNPVVDGMSIVIHAQETDETSGIAGPKEVCLPLPPHPVIGTP